MKIGVSFFPSRPKLLLPLAQKADETGFESVWIPEHAVFPTQIETAYPYAEVEPPLPTNQGCATGNARSMCPIASRLGTSGAKRYVF